MKIVTVSDKHLIPKHYVIVNYIEDYPFIAIAPFYKAPFYKFANKMRANAWRRERLAIHKFLIENGNPDGLCT